MAFILLGVAVGATAMALSEHDRDCYRSQRMSMDYLGNKNGADIYKDRVSGYYFIDDGFDVRRVGRNGWRPNPADLERLKGKLAKYNPQQLKFSGYILASFIDNEQKLWNILWNKYEKPHKPSKPHFSAIRGKDRKQRYDNEMDEYQKKLVDSKHMFRDENEAWKIARRDQNQSHQHASSGTELLLVALGSEPANNKEVFRITVPTGKKPGDTIQVQAGGETYTIMIPTGSAPGSEIQFEVPMKPVVAEVLAECPTPAAAAATESAPGTAAGVTAQAGSPPSAMNPFDSGTAPGWGGSSTLYEEPANSFNASSAMAALPSASPAPPAPPPVMSVPPPAATTPSSRPPAPSTSSSAPLSNDIQPQTSFKAG